MASGEIETGEEGGSMSGGRERIKPEVVKAVEEAAEMRIRIPSTKELQAKHGISRASIHRIMRNVKERILAERMKQYSQSHE